MKGGDLLSHLRVGAGLSLALGLWIGGASGALAQAPTDWTDAGPLLMQQRDQAMKSAADANVMTTLLQKQLAASEAQKVELMRWLCQAQGKTEGCSEKTK